MKIFIAIIAGLPVLAFAKVNLLCVGEVANGHYDYKPEYRVYEEERKIRFSYKCEGSYPQSCAVEVGGKDDSARRYINSDGHLIIGLADNLDFVFFVDSREIQLEMKGGSAKKQRWFNGVCSRS
jgi:hypothetical protein